jgi:hypothetical protein
MRRANPPIAENKLAVITGLFRLSGKKGGTICPSLLSQN